MLPRSLIGTTVFCGKFFHGPVCQIPLLTIANFQQIVINFLWPPIPTKYAVFVASNCNWQIQTASPKKLAIFHISWAQYFQYSSCQSPSGRHVFHGEIMYTYITVAWTPPKYGIFVPYISGQYRSPQNSVKIQKFRGNGQIPRLGSKFRVLRKTVVPNH